MFQRTPTWAIEREDQPTPPDIVEAFEAAATAPNLDTLIGKNYFRTRISLLLSNNSMMKNGMQKCALLSERIKQDVKDPEL